MNEKIKTDYIKYIFRKSMADLNRYDISNSDKELMNSIINRLTHSENLLRDIYILSHIKELNSIGRYSTYVLKKIEDGVINFDNLSQNLDTDVEFIENEILNFLSNPKLRENFNYDIKEEPSESATESILTESENIPSETDYELTEEKPEEKEISDFKKNYLELIQSEEEEEETVYELPTLESGETDVTEYISNSQTGKNDIENVEENDNSSLVKIIEDKIDFTDTEKENEDQTENKQEKINEELSEEGTFDKSEDEINEGKDEGKFPLSEEIQKELNLFEEQQKNPANNGNVFEEDLAEITEEPPTNAAFIEYENEIKKENEDLSFLFEKMIDALNKETVNDESRREIIKNIVEKSVRLENISRNMSLEIISNIYQTITLSFEKISDGKYDLSESTLNLFRNGLSLVISLIKGDDYFGYKDILKTIENIRNSLLEEKEKREIYLRQVREKQELEKRINAKFPDDSQKLKLVSLKKLIKDTEIKFNSLEKISGEYQIYEALRSLSGNLNNFKDIVLISKELGLKKLVQLAEASYTFVKFLQNYRINPVTIENQEVFGYIVYNMKSVVIGKPVEDVDIFISYLNDPVKIFSKTERKKT